MKTLFTIHFPFVRKHREWSQWLIDAGSGAPVTYTIHPVSETTRSTYSYPIYTSQHCWEEPPTAVSRTISINPTFSFYHDIFSTALLVHVQETFSRYSIMVFYATTWHHSRDHTPTPPLGLPTAFPAHINRSHVSPFPKRRRKFENGIKMI